MKSIVVFLFSFAVSLSASAAPGLLFIGDSHSVGPFGDELLKRLGKVSGRYDVQRYAIAGSSASTWLKDSICPTGSKCPFTYGYADPKGAKNARLPNNFPGLKKLLQKTNPETVVIALGTNDAHGGCKSPASAIASAEKLAASVGDKQCIWIGPPAYTTGPVGNRCGSNYSPFVDKLKAAVEKKGCRFVDSRQVRTADGAILKSDGPDKVHFGKKGTQWGRSIADRILSGAGSNSPAPALPGRQ